MSFYLENFEEMLMYDHTLYSITKHYVYDHRLRK